MVTLIDPVFGILRTFNEFFVVVWFNQEQGNLLRGAIEWTIIEQ